MIDPKTHETTVRRIEDLWKRADEAKRALQDFDASKPHPVERWKANKRALFDAIDEIEGLTRDIIKAKSK